MIFKKKIKTEPVIKIITSIVLRNGKVLSFERKISEDEDITNGIDLEESQINLQNWWLNPYYPNGDIRLTTTFDYDGGRLLLNRETISYIRIYRIKE
jgi:hypothetical protein